MRPAGLFIGCVSLAFVSSAAIITERNDVLVYPTPPATFVGSSYNPGIDSCWIPYGTYTRGASTQKEYTRVTSNLTGVVYSVLDGYFERYAVAVNRVEVDDDRYFYDKWLFTRTLTPEYYHGVDYSFVFENYIQKNNSSRILDLLNRFNASYYYRTRQNRDGTYDIETTTCSYGGRPLLEQSFAFPRIEWGEIEGILPNYSSRNLEAVVGGSVDPPIVNYWTYSVPFKPADSNKWSCVWPIYLALTNDLHFFTTTPPQVPRVLYDWVDSGPCVSVWGSDVNNAAADLKTALYSMRLPYTMEDVLSLDTGWKYEYPPKLTNDYWTVNGIQMDRGYISGRWDDLAHSAGADWDWSKDDEHYQIQWTPPATWAYSWWNDYGSLEYHVSGSPGDKIIDFGNGIVATKTELYADTDDYTHWANGTTRLDWMRLGILCQLERQMEITYRPRYDEDYLRYTSQMGMSEKRWEATYDFDLSLDGAQYDGGYKKSVAVGSITGWGSAGESVTVVTNASGWSFPTARGMTSGIGGGISGSGVAAGPGIYLLKDDYQGMVSQLWAAEEIPDGRYYFCAMLSLVSTDLGVQSTISNGGLGNESTGEYIPLLGSGSYVCGVGTYSGTAPVQFTRSINKSATGLWTYIDSAAMLTNMVAYPCTNIWNKHYVGAQSRPSLEVRLAVSGGPASPYIGNVNKIHWDSIKLSPYANRAFRMNPRDTDTSTHQANAVVRIDMLRNLDEEVKSMYLQMSAGPGGVDNIRERAMPTRREEGAVIDNLNGKLITAMLGVQAFDGGYIGTNSSTSAALMIDAYIVFEGGVITSFTPQRIFTWDLLVYEEADSDGSFYIGCPYWNFEPLSSDYVDPDETATAVDAHENQMIKTLWRFKNMRDPDL